MSDEACLMSKKAKPAKSKEPLKPTESPGAISDPGKIVSVYLNIFPDSIAEDWSFKNGVGFVHSKECDDFNSEYKMCFFGKTYHRKQFLLRIFRSTERGDRYILKDSLAKGGLFMDEISGFAHPIERKTIVFNSYGESLNVSIDSVEGNSFRDDLDGRIYLRESLVEIRKPNKYKRVSVYSCKNNQNLFKKCLHCDRWWDSVKVQVTPETEGEPYCIDCFDRYITSKVIQAHDSSAYPPPIFKKRMVHRMTGPSENRKIVQKADPHQRLFGVEVEVEIVQKSRKAVPSRAKMAMNAIQALGKDFVITKHDGSLAGTGGPAGPTLGGQHGFEIVSAPADLDEHRERWERLNKMEGFGFLRAWETETCGFHVHVSKAPLTTLQVGRILVFCNHPNNKRFIQSVAGRSEEKYCRFYPKKLNDNCDPSRPDGIKRVSRNDENRRQAINTVPEKTIEFRIFRGTINPRHIIRNLEFVDAVVSFCHPGSRSFNELNDWKYFVKFCSENQKQWPRLCEWLVVHEMILLPHRGDKADKSKLTIKPDQCPESAKNGPEAAKISNGEGVPPQVLLSGARLSAIGTNYISASNKMSELYINGMDHSSTYQQITYKPVWIGADQPTPDPAPIFPPMIDAEDIEESTGLF